MKLIKLALLIGLAFTSCKQSNPSTTKTEVQIEKVNDSKDKEEIQSLIRQALKWADSNNSIDLLPVLTDSKDSVVGFDMNKLKANLDKLRATGFFASEFILNYNQIILTIDKKLKNKEQLPWLASDLPPLAFASDVDPWCLCQDVPYDEPSPWDFIEIEVISLCSDKGEFKWKWGNLKPDTDSDWKEFRYRFRVTKENGKWKIAYLQGFDYEEATR